MQAHQLQEVRKPASGRYEVGFEKGKGYFVVSPKGTRVTAPVRHRAEAETQAADWQKRADRKAKRGPRPCLCCGRQFDSAGIHNRLCTACKARGYATWEGAV